MAKRRLANGLPAVVCGLLCMPLMWQTASAQTPTATAQNLPAATPRISINGAPDALTENIRAHVGMPDERCNANLRRLNRLLPRVRRDVERAAQAIGYYRLTQQVRFTEAVLADDPNAAPACWELEINVTPGEPIRFGEININITDPAKQSLFDEVLAEIPAMPGQILDHSQYEHLKSTLRSQAVENGFFSARFVQSELAIDMDAGAATVNLAFDPGERYRFGDVTISPMDELSDRFLSRFLTFEPGDPYSSEALFKLRQNLSDSQYFNQIAVTPQLSQAVDQHVPVTLDLTTRPRRAYSAGAGVSTDNGPRLRLNYEDRYINRSGHRLNADLAVSTLQQEPSVSYVIPLTDPVNDSLRISTGFLRQETDSYISNTARIGVTWRSLVLDRWIQNVFINYQTEKAELINVTREELTAPTRINSTISGINWARTRADDPIYPSNGWKLFFQVTGAHENLLSDMTFAQFYSSAKFIQRLGPGRIILRTEAATTLADELLELPVSVRFFTGGDQSVRGYQYNELGASNSSGEVVGGKHLLVGSVEYDIRVYGGWSIAAFVDTGNSFQDFGNMTLKESAGLGVRWLSPIGPIRFDVAKGLDDGSFRFHITMGPDL